MIENRGRLIATALIGLVATGCDRKPDERAKAAGEVLEGTISDAMIAPDRVHSEPPLAPRQTDGRGGKGDKAKSPSEADPAESPAPESSPAAEVIPAPATTSSEPAG